MTDFATAHARSTDPQTSHEAASKASDIALAHKAKILTFLVVDAGKRGATIEEIAKGTGLDKHAVARRTADLQQSKLARPLEETRLMSTGRRGRVWVA